MAEQSIDQEIDNAKVSDSQESDKTVEPNFNLESVKDESVKDYIESLKNENIKWRQFAKENKKIAVESQKIAEEKAESALKLIKQSQELSDKRIVEAEIRLVASELGLKKKEYIKLADMSGVKIEEDGTVSGIRESLSELKKSDPELFQTATTTNVGLGLHRKIAAEDRPDFSSIKTMEELLQVSQKYLKS